MSGPGGPGGGRAAAGGGKVAGITMLPEGSTGQIVAAAKEKNVDVLLMFSVKVTRNPRTQLITNDVATSLINPATGSRISVPRLTKISNIAVQKARDGDKNDPVESNVEALFKFVGENLAVRSQLPEGVTREDRIERVRAILEDSNHDKLASLAEIAYYRHAQLFGDVEVQSAFSRILDEEQGIKLATGSAGDKIAVAKTLLPEVPANIWTGEPAGGGGGGLFGGGAAPAGGQPAAGGGGQPASGGGGGGFLGRLFGGRGAARNAQQQNSLKLLALGLHNYHDAYRTFPAVNKDNKGLSWRVHILPFIEQKALYDQFNLNEPWDSPTNKALLAQMPPDFASPGVNQAGMTTIVMPQLGRQGIGGTGIQDITDGSSNTIMLMRVRADKAIPWTAPQDPQITAQTVLQWIDANSPLSVALADGSVRDLKPPFDAAKIFALLTKNGGETVTPE